MQLNLYVTLSIPKENAADKLLSVELVLLFMYFLPNSPETKLKFSIDFQLNSC